MVTCKKKYMDLKSTGLSTLLPYMENLTYGHDGVSLKYIMYVIFWVFRIITYSKNIFAKVQKFSLGIAASVF